MQSDDQIGCLHRHIVPGADFDVAGAGNGLGHAFRQRAAGARDRGCRRSRGPDRQARAVRPACRLPPACARSWRSSRDRCRAIAPGIARTARCRREAPGHSRSHRILDRERHAGGFDPCEALQCRGTALGRDAGGRAADRHGAGALRIPGGEMQGDRAADGDACQRDLAGDPEMIEQGCDVVGHGIEVRSPRTFCDNPAPRVS